MFRRLRGAVGRRRGAAVPPEGLQALGIKGPEVEALERRQRWEQEYAAWYSQYQMQARVSQQTEWDEQYRRWWEAYMQQYDHAQKQMAQQQQHTAQGGQQQPQASNETPQEQYTAQQEAAPQGGKGYVKNRKIKRKHVSFVGNYKASYTLRTASQGCSKMHP